ncbi:MAG: polysaccharide biosynthesis C-terminal domain-containing protein [Candidatus Cloacimonadia bacterium]
MRNDGSTIGAVLCGYYQRGYQVSSVGYTGRKVADAYRKSSASQGNMMNSKLVDILDYNTIAKLAKDPLYRNSFFMAFTSVFNAGCGFFFWMIAARLYTVEEVGLATALISSLGLVILFSRLGFDFSIIRFFPTDDKATVFGTSLVITTIASLLMGVIFILLVRHHSPSLAFLNEPICTIAFLFIGVMNSVTAITGRAFFANRNSEYYLFQNIFIALRIPLLVPLAFLGTFGIFGSYGLSFLVASFFALVVIRRSIAAIRPEVSTDFIMKSLKFTSWNYVSSILSTAPTLILPLMVLNILGEAEAAKYYIAFAIGNVVLIIPNSLGTSLFVEGSHGVGLKKSAIRAGVASLILLIPTVLAIFLFGDLLLGLLKAEYADAFDLLRVLALSSFLVSVYSLFISIQNVRMKVESVLKLNALRCILLLGLSYVLIQRYGILGVGYGWSITFTTISLAIVWVMIKDGWVRTHCNL